ncbi:Auxin response factor [Thalictrum thalictroides]|uniref:Auxin response factor n=1 Tax=Thalictrum thalictroides TaxID=46969 RepID=A0A7J6WF46_THATH|nr:Auxin response factor [Thalictrum thalictroides]
MERSNFDLNNYIVDEEEDGLSVIDGFTSSSSSTSSTVCLELWHACAGPLISLPKKGNVVVYLPQGHLEQISEIPISEFYDLPSHVFCRVVDVKLHAELANDELYAQVSLVPDTEIQKKFKDGDIEMDGDEEEMEGGSKSMMTPHMFCKTLTASDTSTHGGFSVPRRAAEDCFPPLDYTQQRPSQELVAKDLHGVEWKFRHIYRGQPRRHLLTTGWSAFVNRKKLVSGDAVLFLRGEDGELRLGIRRAPQYKGSIPFSALCSESLESSSLTAVAKAVSKKCVFNIYYTPRESPSGFVVPLRKFSKSIDHSFAMGMRFKIRFESEDAAERRYTGLIIGIGDIDPLRWPKSKWRCISVRWDDDVEFGRHNRVSPWEIEVFTPVSGSGSFLLSGSKRNRINLPFTRSDFPVSNGAGCLDFEESLRFQKVLQGQENLEFNTPWNDIGLLNHQRAETRNLPSLSSSGMAAMGNGVRTATGCSDITYNRIGCEESVGFHKVLQGQEKYSNPHFGRAVVDNRVQYDGVGTCSIPHRSMPDGECSSMMNCYDGRVQPPTPSLQVSSPSSVLMFQQASSQVAYSAYGSNNQEKKDYANYDLSDDRGVQGGTLRLSEDAQNNLVPNNEKGCRLFGFSLIKESHAASEDNTTTMPITLSLDLYDSSSRPSIGSLSHLKPPKLTKTFGGSNAKAERLISQSVMGMLI